MLNIFLCFYLIYFIYISVITIATWTRGEKVMQVKPVKGETSKRENSYQGKLEKRRPGKQVKQDRVIMLYFRGVYIFLY